MMVQRIMAVLAAVFLVGAVAIAVIGSPDAPLGAALYAFDKSDLYAVQTHVGAWIWDGVAVPLLVRPAWLIPACMGILCAGLALTFANLRGPQRTPRRRM